MRSPLLHILLFGVLLALPSHGLRAQSTLASRHRYWDASTDSLRQVLAGQRADTARLRTLRHMTQVYGEKVITETERAELVALTHRLHTPDHRAHRLWLASIRLRKTPATSTACLDSMKLAVAVFDSLGQPAQALLSGIRVLYNSLNQQEAKRTYYEGKLAYYEPRHAAENMAACYHALGGYYTYKGDYNQALGYYLRAGELYRSFYCFSYYNGISVIGATYANWGNYDRALPYLQRALAWGKLETRGTSFLNRTIATLYLKQRRYPQALRYAEQALTPRNSQDTISAEQKAYGWVLKSAVLLAMGRVADAGQLLPRTQHVADSLQMPLRTAAGPFELNATWARYHTARGDFARAEAAWLAAYRQSQQTHAVPERLSYLRELGRFYQQRRQPARATPYALAANALADSLEVAQGALHVAQYETQQADRAQQARIAGLRLAQVQDAARARRQRWVLGAVLGGAALLVLVAAVLYYAFRRSERLKQLVTNQKQDLQAQRDQLNASLTELRTTQAQLIQREKMASLGELTAGIAHEIQNPLNFVNNFSKVSTELLDELEEEQAKPRRDAALETELVGDLRQNLGKITQHGKRAAAIVKGMLEHSRTSTGERQPADLNALCDEYLRLAYHGLRAKDKTFNATLETDFAPGLPPVEVVAGDLGRVLLNLYSNAFYAVQQRQRLGAPEYAPVVKVSTRRLGNSVGIRVVDNGLGMSAEVQQKIFQPFFTTKPTGEGTGLGLSLSYDIVGQGHGGTLTVESQPGHGATFIVSLPA